jgi:DNA-binding response OmpR family regulator
VVIAVAAPMHATRRSPSTEARRAGGPRALVVTADGHGAATTTRILTDLGYDAKVSWDGVSGTELALDEAPEVVLVDAYLPQRSGFDLCRAVKLALGSAVAVIVVGPAGDDDLEAAFDAGADDFIAWPARRRELVARLDARHHRRPVRCAS